MDLGLFRWINGMSDAIEPEMRFLSEATNYLWFKAILLAMVLFLIFKKDKYRASAIQALLSFLIANGITDLFKHMAAEARPCTAIPDWVNHGIGCSGSAGTASAHSANMAAVAFVFTYHLGGWGAVWIVIALLTGISRVYVGAHYPHQVLLGWAVGAAAGFLVCRTWDYIAEQRANVIEISDELPEL